MFRKFQGAKITCDICEENKSFKVGLDRNITEQDILFADELKEDNWGTVANFELCPDCYKEYKNADDKEKWRSKHNIL